MKKQEEIREGLAELEHDQWVKWSMNLVASEGQSNISGDRLQRWRALWKPYSELTESQKYQDRVWADKTLEYLHSQDVVIKSAKDVLTMEELIMYGTVEPLIEKKK